MKRNNKGFVEDPILIGLMITFVIVATLFFAICLINEKKIKKEQKLTESKVESMINDNKLEIESIIDNKLKIESIINNNDTFIYNGVEIDSSTAKELLKKGYFAFREKGTTKVYIEKDNTCFIQQPTS